MAAGIAVVSVGGMLAYISWPSVQPKTSPRDPHGVTTNETPPEPSRFCAEGLETLAQDACFSPHVEAHGLVVYLHGRYSPDTEREELDRQSRVARLAGTHAYAVLALRGIQGECTTTELKDYFCWPSNPRNAQDATSFVDRITPVLATAKERVKTNVTFLLGFSNGAYFASIIAERALVAFDAIAIAHGGPLDADNSEPPRTTPLLLVTADDDPSDGEMQSLDRELTRRNWAHDMIAREGGHALPDWDITMALTFFERTRTEKLPLRPPLARRESHHVVEEVEEAGDDQ